MIALRPGATETDFFRKEGAENMRAVEEGDLASAEEVARDGYEAMMSGTASVAGRTRSWIRWALSCRIRCEPNSPKSNTRRLIQPGSLLRSARSHIFTRGFCEMG